LHNGRSDDDVLGRFFWNNNENGIISVLYRHARDGVFSHRAQITKINSVTSVVVVT
jgi:hypothetical protein